MRAQRQWGGAAGGKGATTKSPKQPLRICGLRAGRGPQCAFARGAREVRFARGNPGGHSREGAQRRGGPGLARPLFLPRGTGGEGYGLAPPHAHISTHSPPAQLLQIKAPHPSSPRPSAETDPRRESSRVKILGWDEERWCAEGRQGAPGAITQHSVFCDEPRQGRGVTSPTQGASWVHMDNHQDALSQPHSPSRVLHLGLLKPNQHVLVLEPNQHLHSRGNWGWGRPAPEAWPQPSPPPTSRLGGPRRGHSCTQIHAVTAGPLP